MQEDHADVHTGGHRDDGERERGGDLVREGEGGDAGGGRGQRGTGEGCVDVLLGDPSGSLTGGFCSGLSEVLSSSAVS
jgi:hypothetical protein